MKTTVTTFILLIGLSLSACASGQPPIIANTPTSANTATMIIPSSTATPTLTPFPSSTPIPPTPTLDKRVQDPESGHWYLVLEPMTWDRAIDFCSRLGGHLAVIESASEDDFVFSGVIRPRWGADDILLGATDKEREGRWVWVTGERMTYTNWIDGEPNNCGFFETYGKCVPENYLTYNPDHPGQWNDVPVRGAAKYLCEFEN